MAFDQENFPESVTALKRLRENVGSEVTMKKQFLKVVGMMEPMLEAYPNLYLLNGYFNFYTFHFALRKKWEKAAEVEKLFLNLAKNGEIDKIRRKYMKNGATPPETRSIEMKVSAMFFKYAF